MTGTIFLSLVLALQQDPQAQAALLANQEAALGYETWERSWWPVAALEAPVAVLSGNDAGSALTGSLNGSLTQKLPGGGSLTLGTTQSLSRPFSSNGVEVSRGFSLSLSQPLGGGDAKAEVQRRLANLWQRKTLRDRFLVLVARAAALDTSRMTQKATQAAWQAAHDQEQILSAWQAQGRATAAEAWKAARTTEQARWTQDKATLGLEALSAAWAVLAPVEEWSLEAVEELEANLRGRPKGYDVEDAIDAMKLALADQEQALVERASAPRLLASVGGQQPDSQPWTYSAQLGITISSDSLATFPLLRQRAETERSRLQITAKGASSERELQRSQRTALLSETSAYRALVTEQLTRQTQLTAEVRGLVSAGKLAQADLSTALAESASLVEEQRKTLWDLILLRVQDAALP